MDKKPIFLSTMQTHNCMVKEDEFQERLKSYSVYLKRNLLLKLHLQLMFMANKNVQRLEEKFYLHAHIF